MSDLTLHAVKVGFADARRQAEDGRFQQSAHTVTVGTGSADGGLHGLFHRLIQHREALFLAGKSFHLCSQSGRVVQ